MMSWDVLSFNEAITDITGGNRKFKSSEYSEKGKYPIIDQGEGFIAGFTDDEVALKVNNPLIIFGDHTRILKYVDFDFCLGADGVKVLKTSDSLLPKYAFFYLQKANIPSMGYSRHFKFLKELNFPVPPLPIQKAIAEKLDKADALRKKDQQLLKFYDELAQSVFIDMFGDPVKNEKGWHIEELGKVCDVRDGTHDSPKYVSEGFPLITSKNLTKGEIDFENVNYITQNDFDLINKRSFVDIGDILMPMIGTIGNPIIVKVTDKFAIKNVALFKFHNSEDVKNTFVHSVLRSDSYNEKLKSENRGGTQKFVSLGTIRKLLIPIPTLPLQEKFATIVENIEQQKQNVKQQAAESENLFQSLLQESFN